MSAVELQWSLGDCLYKARRAAGLSQAQFGEIVGVSRGTVSRWENDQDEPTVGQLRRLSEAASAPWLLDSQNWKLMRDTIDLRVLTNPEPELPFPTGAELVVVPPPTERDGVSPRSGDSGTVAACSV